MGRYISTTGTAGAVTREVSTTYAALVNDRILADSTGGAFTITLPANAGLLINDTIQIIDATSQTGVNAITVGIDCTLSWVASCLFSSILIFAKITLPLHLFIVSSNSGVSCLHGPHQGAQRSTMIILLFDSSITFSTKSFSFISK